MTLHCSWSPALPSPRDTDPALGAVLAAAASLLQMEVVFLAGITDKAQTIDALLATADIPGLVEGAVTDRSDTFCHRMLAGAAPHTSDLAHDPDYTDVPGRVELGLTSYVGVPVTGPAGDFVATLCGIDRRSVKVSEEAIGVLRQLAGVVSAQLGEAAAERYAIRSLPDGGWRVADEELEDLLSAVVLADLAAGAHPSGSRPARSDVAGDELTTLRLQLKQLEHAFGARVVIEQAIGVLSERLGSSPREAFETLRKVARSRGSKVLDLADEIIASSTDADVELPREFRRR